jgi:hypothetical protein
MKIPADIRYTEEMLCEAMVMLADLSRNMGLFQRQDYGKLKRRFDQHGLLSAGLRTALNGIDTTPDEKGAENDAREKKQTAK